MPGVVTNSMSSPSSLKNPWSRATSTGRSWTAFMIATCGFLPVFGFLVMSVTVMAFLLSVEVRLSPHEGVGALRGKVVDRDRVGHDLLFGGRARWFPPPRAVWF